MNETRFPLCWPSSWKRTAASSRRRAQFKKNKESLDGTYQGTAQISVWDGVQRVYTELYLLDISEPCIIVSTNIPVRKDGIPRSDRAEAADPGVAVYWKKNGKPQCMAIDRYDRVADNLAAIAATLEALRAIERHGGGSVMDRAFAGFAQLPAAIVTQRPWRDVLRFAANSNPTKLQIEEQFRKVAKELHPDKDSGSHDAMVELGTARAAALEEVG